MRCERSHAESGTALVVRRQIALGTPRRWIILLNSFSHRQHPPNRTVRLDAANRETFLVVQVETPEAIANIEQMAATPGLDRIFVGPGDLGLRIRRTKTNLTLDAAFEKVAAACARHGIAWGTPVGSPEDLAKRQNQGGQLLARGGDFGGMMNILKTSAQTFAHTTRKA